MNTALLKQYGIHVEDGLARCLNDEKLYGRLLQMFLKDPAFSEAKTAFEAGDDDALFRALHEMKGSCGNIAMPELYEAVSTLLELLRHHTGTPAERADCFTHIEALYTSILTGIRLGVPPSA